MAETLSLLLSGVRLVAQTFPKWGSHMLSAISDEVLDAVAAGGASDAGGLPVGLLGDFLPALTSAVVAGKPLSQRQMAAYQAIGDEAARQGVALRALLDLYLSAAWRLWRHLPAVLDFERNPNAVVVAGEVMLHAVDDAVAALAEGYQLARRSLVRVEESARREFIDDLLSGGSDVLGVLDRAAGYGLDLAGPQAVAVVLAERPFADGTPFIGTVERAIQGRKGDADALVASKNGRLAVVFPAPDQQAIDYVVGRIGMALRAAKSRGWRIGTGRPGAGAHGVLASYREATDALDLAGQLGLDTPVVNARDLLVYHVLLRDRPAITDLVETLLSPLLEARGGPQPMLDTLAAYFGCGSNAARTARNLHLSVRAVTYRLQRVHTLIGLDPADPANQFQLQAAVLGARLLGWPAG
ncbi:MAG: helix-turn-helix domain-containing protein [Jatrophihabitantaceae bacterium]